MSTTKAGGMDKGTIVAIGIAAFAAGMALTSMFRNRAPAPVVLPEGGLPTASEQPATPDPNAAPEDGGAISLAGVYDDLENIKPIFKDMIEAMGELRRRVEALEAAGGGNGGATKRYDPDTGQAYTPEGVWVPEGLGDEAMKYLRRQALGSLAAKARWQKWSELVNKELDVTNVSGTSEETRLRMTLGIAAEHWKPLVIEFAAAWQNRESETFDEFLVLLGRHLFPLLREYGAEVVQLPRSAAIPYMGPNGCNGTTDLLKTKYTAMRSALRKDWRAFVDTLPFEVKSEYLGWCSDFLKGE